MSADEKSKFDWDSIYAVKLGKLREMYCVDDALLDLHDRVKALEGYRSADDLDIEVLEKLSPSSLALRIVALATSHSIMEKMWKNQTATLADLRASVVQFVAWAEYADSLSMTAARDEVLAKLHELGLSKA